MREEDITTRGQCINRPVGNAQCRQPLTCWRLAKGGMEDSSRLSSYEKLSSQGLLICLAHHNLSFSKITWKGRTDLKFMHWVPEMQGIFRNPSLDHGCKYETSTHKVNFSYNQDNSDFEAHGKKPIPQLLPGCHTKVSLSCSLLNPHGQLTPQDPETQHTCAPTPITGNWNLGQGRKPRCLKFSLPRPTKGQVASSLALCCHQGH